MTTHVPALARADLRPGPVGEPSGPSRRPPAALPRPADIEPADVELEGAVRAALCDKGYSPLRAVGVDAAGGRVLLSGPVPSFHLKQVAQEAARSVPGVSGLVNQLAVPDAP